MQGTPQTMQINPKYHHVLLDIYDFFEREIEKLKKFKHNKKRNVGINSSRSENIVCLDDDCIPGDNFLNAHHKALVNITNQKKIFSGKVYFPRELSENSNFHRFRNERHRAYDINYIGKKNIHKNFWMPNE